MLDSAHYSTTHQTAEGIASAATLGFMIEHIATASCPEELRQLWVEISYDPFYSDTFCERTVSLIAGFASDRYSTYSKTPLEIENETLEPFMAS